MRPTISVHACPLDGSVAIGAGSAADNRATGGAETGVCAVADVATTGASDGAAAAEQPRNGARVRREREMRRARLRMARSGVRGSISLEDLGSVAGAPGAGHVPIAAHPSDLTAPSATASRPHAVRGKVPRWDVPLLPRSLASTRGVVDRSDRTANRSDRVVDRSDRAADRRGPSGRSGRPGRHS